MYKLKSWKIMIQIIIEISHVMGLVIDTILTQDFTKVKCDTKPLFNSNYSLFGFVWQNILKLKSILNPLWSRGEQNGTQKLFSRGRFIKCTNSMKIYNALWKQNRLTCKLFKLSKRSIDQYSSMVSVSWMNSKNTLFIVFMISIVLCELLIN